MPIALYRPIKSIEFNEKFNVGDEMAKWAALRAARERVARQEPSRGNDVWKSGFDYTDIVKFDSDFLPELLKLPFFKKR